MRAGRSSGVRRLRGGATAALLLVVAVLATSGQRNAAAQEGSPSVRYAAVVLSPHAHGTMVGVALRVPAGSGRDAPGSKGTAHLLARVRERQAARRLDPARAILRARVGRTATTYTLLATPEAWIPALEQVHDLLFLAPVPADLTEAERTRILETLVFEEGSPVRAFRAEAASLLVEAGSPWATPVRGTSSSVATLTPAVLESFQEARMDAGTASVAVAGPVDAGAPETARALGLAPGGVPAPGDPNSRVAADTTAVPTPALPWRVGQRTAQVQEVTSAWISVAWPAPDSLSRTALELLAHLMEEELDPVPPDPDRYSVEVGLVDTPGGPVLQVQASVLPEALARWEGRIVGAVDELADSPMPDDFFRWKRRRFRTRRLLAEAAPEAEAARMAADLAILGRARALDREVWELDAGSLRDAARALGEPRILLLGPDLGQDGPDGAGYGDPAR